MTRRSQFHVRLRDRAPMLGTWVKTPSPLIAEVLGFSPLDVICLDAEHAPFDRWAIDQSAVAARMTDMPLLVRIPTAAPEHILNALDCGADGIVAPHVMSAEAAALLVKAAYHGCGGRGYAGSSRAAGFGNRNMADNIAAARSKTAVIAQIEDVAALNEIEAIAKVEGIDCLFVGRIDLTVALGAQSPADPVVIEAVEQICAAGRAANRAVGMFVSDLNEIAHWRAAGASLFILSSDHGFLLAAAKDLCGRFHAAVG
ncbi:MAG: aldolase/citrate lyase family protein [Sphingomonadales bacterium]